MFTPIVLLKIEKFDVNMNFYKSKEILLKLFVLERFTNSLRNFI